MESNTHTGADPENEEPTPLLTQRGSKGNLTVQNPHYDEESQDKKIQTEETIINDCHKFDFWLSSFVYSHSSGIFEYVILTGASLFGHKLMPVSIIASAYIIGFGGAVFMALCSVCCALVTTLGKHFFGRIRPDPSLLSRRIFEIRSQFTNPAFPSGDTAQAAVFGTVVYLLRRWILILIVIPWAAFGRVYYGCHWVGDTVAGALVGAVMSYICFSLAPGSLVQMDFPSRVLNISTNLS